MPPKATTHHPLWLPIAIAVAIVAGLYIGKRINPGDYVADGDRKLNAILNLINHDYVDSTNLRDLVEMSIPEILSNLDPHTVYLSAAEVKSSNEEETDSLHGNHQANSIDAHYMIDKTTGYVHISHFGRQTYKEFQAAMQSLKNDGAKRYMLDLRGNGGGFMEMAELIANEFLPADMTIVSTRGRYKRDNNDVWSDGKGAYKDVELAILIDEGSASASEILAGALQDNDRALVVGSRSFGKGLVQKDFVLPDSSVIRLTTARYYTPSGRCIQKDYKHGNDKYADELVQRYRDGEMFSRDSIKIDKSQSFKTRNGRTVYGGGGIVPDVFVSRDTSWITGYFREVERAGMLQKFAKHYCNQNRVALSKMKNYKQFMRMSPSDEALIGEFAEFAAACGIPPRWYYINQSHERIVTMLKALIAEETFGHDAYYPIINRNDKVVLAALKALNQHKASIPITESLERDAIVQNSRSGIMSQINQFFRR